MIRKAVRDLLHTMPAEGWTFEQVDNETFLGLLLAKLTEESAEVQDAVKNGAREDIVNELADLLEVMDEVAQRLGINSDEVAEAQYRKGLRRGRFTENWVGEKS